MATGSIEFGKAFGAKAPVAAGKAGSKEERPKAQYWLNIGYSSGVADEHGNDRFVSLPAGIPLDGQERVKVSGNTEFAAFQSARNDLMDQIMALAETLQPGEAKTLSLEIQLRRVNEEQAAIPADKNPFARALNLVA